MSFPLNPVASQQFTKDGVLYRFNPPRGWEIERQTVAGAPATAVVVMTQATAPTAIVIGLQWYRTTTSQLFICVNDSGTLIWREI
jgi:hypothetical protein